jgi:Kef-type K+ transport system membrane component KefB
MNVGTTLVDILVVLLTAKAAAEIAERAGVPAVVGEIVAGVLIGPSALGFVQSSNVLQTLAELGVILLLLEVGMSMRLGELVAVGRASTSVAIVGVVIPTALGLGTMLALGHSFNVSLFVGAALAATSVGITARVFNDLRALATVEARTVLGAAVADDVLGLIILTVVVRLATGGSLSPWSLLGIVGAALGFLLLTTIAGQWIGPQFFGHVERFSRSPGTMVALAFAFTLGFAKLADTVQLAPIVGAFVAGVSLSGSAQRERIQRELRPVGHLLVPVFFLEIGIQANLQEFVRPTVLVLAAVLLVIAVVGKLAAPIGAYGAPGDKWLIGLGMIPRGEVGLIFASIGLQDHVLGHDLYAALLLVILATTVATPPLLRVRLLQLRVRSAAASREVQRPSAGWLVARDGTVDLSAIPPTRLALHVGLEVALALAARAPSPGLLDWFGDLDPEQPLDWDADATQLLFRVLLEGNERSWRFLETTALLERALPELATALRTRRADPFRLDPGQLLRFALVDRVRTLTTEDPAMAEHWRALEHPEWLLFAALVLEIADDQAPVAVARQLVNRLDLGANAEEEIALLVSDTHVLPGAAQHLGPTEEETVLQIATRLQTAERARALGILSAALDQATPTERQRLDALVDLILATIANPSLSGRVASNTVSARRLHAIARVGEDTTAAERIRHAPRAYVLSQDPIDIARHAQLLDPVPRARRPRVHVRALAASSDLQIEVATRDRPGLLATITGVLTEAGLDVRRAVVTTWPDGAALDVFGVHVEARLDVATPDADGLERAMAAAFHRPLRSGPEPGAAVRFDDSASPWYTVCEVQAPDHAGLLHDITVAFTAAGADIHSAEARTDGEQIVDVFALTDHSGRKVSESVKWAVEATLRSGTAIDAHPRAHRRGWTALRRVLQH